jgi:hypothetical protein
MVPGNRLCYFSILSFFYYSENYKIYPVKIIPLDIQKKFPISYFCDINLIFYRLIVVIVFFLKPCNTTMNRYIESTHFSRLIVLFHVWWCLAKTACTIVSAWTVSKIICYFVLFAHWTFSISGTKSHWYILYKSRSRLFYMTFQLYIVGLMLEYFKSTRKNILF